MKSRLGPRRCRDTIFRAGLGSGSGPGDFGWLAKVAMASSDARGRPALQGAPQHIATDADDGDGDGSPREGLRHAVTSAIELADERAKIVADGLDLRLQLLGLLVRRVAGRGLSLRQIVRAVARDLFGGRHQATLSLANLTSSSSSRRVRAIGRFTRLLHPRAPPTAANNSTAPLTHRPAAHAGSTAVRARIAVTRSRFTVVIPATAAKPMPATIVASLDRFARSSALARSTCAVTRLCT